MKLGKVSKLVLYIVLLILWIGSSTLLIAGAVAPAHVSATPVLTSQDCPDAPPASSSSTATLLFCSPVNQGYVGGPYGTHIVLIGENFSAKSLKWFYELQVPGQPNASLDANEKEVCFHGNKECPLSSLVNPVAKTIAQGTLFEWNWNAISLFPKKIASYYLIAIGQSSQGFFSAISTLAFSVLSLQAPCVVAISANGSSPPDCSQSQQLSFTSSSSLQNISLAGSNWLLQGPNNEDVGASVTITVICDPDSERLCNLTSLPPVTVSADSSGQFTKQISLSANLVGAYNICIASHAANVATPISSPNNNDTVVNNALTYGCTQLGDAPRLSITMKQVLPPPPHPTAQPTPVPTPTPKSLLSILDQWLDILTYLGLILILVAFVLFFSYRRFATSGTPNMVNKVSSPPSQDSDQQTTSVVPQHPVLPQVPQPTYLMTREQWWSEAEQREANQSSNALSLLLILKMKGRAKRIARLIQSGQINSILQLANVALVSDENLWSELCNRLYEIPHTAIPNNLAERAFTTLKWIDGNLQNPDKLAPACSETIVLYEILLPRTSANSPSAADIAYNLGYAYSALSTSRSATTIFLLNLAHKNFESALQIYDDKQMISQQICTLRNLANIHFAHSSLSSDNENYHRNEGTLCLQKAEALNTFIKPRTFNADRTI